MSDLPAFAALSRARIDGIEVALRGPDRAATWGALRAAAALLALDHRAVLRIEGADAADLLHRVTSQETRRMGPGAGAPATILTGKGRLAAYFELFRPGPDLFLAEVDRSRRPVLRALLDRYLFGERVVLAEPDWVAAGVFGPAAAGHVDAALPGVRVEGGGFLVASAELGVPAYRVHGPAADVEAFARRAVAAGLPCGGCEDYDELRIDAGKPRLGRDTDDTTIPLEVGLDDACDPDKGCYIGQEVVARIRTYGHVNRRLCRVEVEAATCPGPGTLVYDDGVEAGRITSSYLPPAGTEVHGLALLPQVLAAAGTELRCGAADGAVTRVV